MKIFKDIEYGNQSEQQKLDLYLPSVIEGPYPVVVYIHGGAWLYGDKNDGEEKEWFHLVNNGYALASINYRFINEVKHPGGLMDCRKAVNYLAEHAEEYNIDPDRIAVFGLSAGGYYALMLATTNDSLKFKVPDQKNADIKSCVALFSPTDFYQGKKNVVGSLLNRIKYSISIAVAENYFGKPLRDLSQKELKEASPSYYITENLPPTLLQQGSNDFVVPKEQADIFQKQVEKAGVGDKFSLEIFNGANHNDSMFFTWDNKLRVQEFFDENLKEK